MKIPVVLRAVALCCTLPALHSTASAIPATAPAAATAPQVTASPQPADMQTATPQKAKAAPPASPQPAAEIRERAQGYGHKTLQDVTTVNATDGIDAEEAMAMVELQILGSVDVTGRPVQHYGKPRRENDDAIADETGDWWVVDVFIAQPDGTLINQPIRIDAITSETGSKGWYSVGADATRTGDSWFRLRRQKDNSIRLVVNLDRYGPEHDAQLRADCLRDALAAAAIINRNFAERFLPLTEADFTLHQRKWHDIEPRPVWQWVATATLSEKPPGP